MDKQELHKHQELEPQKPDFDEIGWLVTEVVVICRISASILHLLFVATSVPGCTRVGLQHQLRPTNPDAARPSVMI